MPPSVSASENIQGTRMIAGIDYEIFDLLARAAGCSIQLGDEGGRYTGGSEDLYATHDAVLPSWKWRTINQSDWLVCLE